MSGLSQPRTIFGVHSLTPYSRTTGIPYGMARVLEGSTFKMTGALVELKGGSNRYTWQVEDGDIKAELAFSMSEYPDWIYELFGGKAPTEGSAETGGATTALTNLKGTSVVAATGLLSAVTVLTSGSNLKFGRYVVKATGAAAFDVYCLGDVDFGRGTVGTFLDDTLKIASFTALTTGGTKDIASFSLEFTGGAGTIALVSGDTATFEVRAINTMNDDVVLGGITDVFPDFGAIAYAQKSGSGLLFELEIYKLKNIGLTLGAQRKQFAKNDYTALASYDSVKDAVARVRQLQ